MHCQERERWDSVQQLWCFDYLEGGRKKGKKASWELKQRTKEVIIGCNDEKAMDYDGCKRDQQLVQSERSINLMAYSNSQCRKSENLILVAEQVLI